MEFNMNAKAIIIFEYREKISVLKREIDELETKLYNIKRAFEKKEEEEQKAKDIINKRRETLNVIYALKKNKLTDVVADAIEVRISGESTQNILNCYANIKQKMQEDKLEISNKIRSKENEIYRLQKKILEQEI